MILYFDNLLPVLVAAVIQFLFGWLWYSPKVFGCAWTNGMGLRKDDCCCSWYTLVGAFAVSFLTAWVFAGLLDYFDIQNPLEGAWLGFWIWLGFIVTKLFSGYLWSRHSFSVFLINIGHQLISLVFFGYFLTAWQ